MDSSSFHSLVHILITLGFWMIKGWAVPILKIFWFLQWLPVNQEDLKSITFWFRSNLYQTVTQGLRSKGLSSVHFIVVSILFLNSSSFETTLNEIFLCSQLLCSKQHSPEQILDFYHYQTGTTNLEQLLLDLQIINDFDKKMKDFQEILDLSIRNSFGFKMFSGPTRKKIDDEIQMSVLDWRKDWSEHKLEK